MVTFDLLCFYCYFYFYFECLSNDISFLTEKINLANLVATNYKSKFIIEKR